MLVAIRQAIRSRRDFTAFDVYLCSENTDQVDEWARGLDDWMADNTQPDPFRVSISGSLSNHCLRCVLNVLRS